MISSKQNTLAQSAEFQGVGIHTGKPCTVRVKPSPINSGRVFVTANGVKVPARVDYVVSCDRSTILGSGEDRVHTPEHLLSAMASLGVDNAIIELTGPEIPILDGSAKQFCDGLSYAGVAEQEAEAKIYSPLQPYSVQGSNGDLVLVVPAPETSFHYVLHYDHPMLGCQTVDFYPENESFESKIAEARTFALWEEVKPLLERGMALGGTLENALVVYPDKYSSALKMENEPVHHKCLDLIGDFALLDARIQAKVLAVKAGHKMHVECAKLLWEGMKSC